MLKKIAPYAKAVTGGVVAGLTAYISVAPDGVNGAEWANIAVATVAGLGLVFAVPNKDPKAMHQDESVQPPDEPFTGYAAGV